MDEQLQQTLQNRLEILRDEMAVLPEGMRIDPKQLLKETMEENLAIAKMDGNKSEMRKFESALLMIDELE